MEQTYYQRVLLAVIWTFTSVATLVVSLRLLTRVKVRNVAGFDDLIISFSLVSHVGPIIPSLFQDELIELK